jgi:dTDP-glucose 4,6-dehydratase
MNNFGERQHPEKFVPMAITRLLAGEPVPIHGRPWYEVVENRTPPTMKRWTASSRVWLHARNHADAIRYLLDEVPFPTYESATDLGDSTPVRFNVAGEREIGVDEIVTMIADTLGVEPLMEWTDFHSSRPGHDLRYSLDGTALKDAGWEPPVPLDESFARTVNWYVDHPQWLGVDVPR